mmetsp:Transcript_105268/g.297521  ORF Transcript_105268/g.297521 Transcript_105268/m.297521 type:complete len:301 (+) Transcript_105268:224-1126(+)
MPWRSSVAAPALALGPIVAAEQPRCRAAELRRPLLPRWSVGGLAAGAPRHAVPAEPVHACVLISRPLVLGIALPRPLARPRPDGDARTATAGRHWFAVPRVALAGRLGLGLEPCACGATGRRHNPCVPDLPHEAAPRILRAVAVVIPCAQCDAVPRTERQIGAVIKLLRLPMAETPDWVRRQLVQQEHAPRERDAEMVTAQELQALTLHGSLVQVNLVPPAHHQRPLLEGDGADLSLRKRHVEHVPASKLKQDVVRTAWPQCIRLLHVPQRLKPCNKLRPLPMFILGLVRRSAPRQILLQ